MPLSIIQPIAPSANRNMLTNGDFMIWQQNEISNQTGSGGKKPIDGWRQGQSNVGQLVTKTERFTDAPANTGLKHCFKATVTTPETALASNEDLTLSTKIEGFDCQKLMYGTANAKTTTLSFWVKSSIAGTFAARIYQEDGNDNISKPYTISSANTWEYKTITYPGNTLAAILNDNTTGLQILWYLSVGGDSLGGSNGDVWHNYVNNKAAFGHVTNSHITTINSTFQLTGVQFEIGHVSTPFEFKSFEQNLAKCQRYYFKSSFAHAAYATTGIYAEKFIYYPVPMRTTPAINITGGDAYNIGGQSVRYENGGGFTGFGHSVGPNTNGMCYIGGNSNPCTLVADAWL